MFLESAVSTLSFSAAVTVCSYHEEVRGKQCLGGWYVLKVASTQIRIQHFPAEPCIVMRRSMSFTPPVSGLNAASDRCICQEIDTW